MEQRNILLITIDSLRHDYAELLDIDTELFSRVRGIFDEPIEFSQAVANGPNTPNSFPAILTSTHSFMYGGYTYLDERRPFIARTLQEAGYETVSYHSNPHLGSNRNYDFGFDIFNDSAEASDTVSNLKDGVERRLDPDSKLYSLLRRLWHIVSISTNSAAYAKAPTITNNAIDWITDWNRTDPFFMWLHYMDVHYPFTPPEDCLKEVGVEPLSTRRVADLNGRMHESPETLTDEDTEALLKLYLGEIVFVDKQIHRILTVLEDHGLLENTAVFVTSDHGESFGEHGEFGHHSYMYDELIRVPMIASIPGYERRTITDQVSLADLGPTIYDLVDIEIPKAVQGESFEPLLAGNSRGNYTALSTASNGSVLATRTPNWKCLWDRDETIELYDLDNDPDELTDVSDDYPDTVDRFIEEMKSYLSDADETDTALPSVEESEQIKQRLEDLGYVD